MTKHRGQSVRNLCFMHCQPVQLYQGDHRGQWKSDKTQGQWKSDKTQGQRTSDKTQGSKNIWQNTGSKNIWQNTGVKEHLTKHRGQSDKIINGWETPEECTKGKQRNEETNTHINKSYSNVCCAWKEVSSCMFKYVSAAWWVVQRTPARRFFTSGTSWKPDGGYPTVGMIKKFKATAVNCCHGNSWLPSGQ